MAALVEGQQYGLSAQDKINCTKSLVFVKLTDSALRSIEEYVKNKADTISKPTIQFQNFNGVISLPQNGNSQKYGFTLSNVEADGPQGSFECLRQTGHRSLESLGCMQLKMHIHANEDSYENTRVKMAAVEKEQKKSCTKVIKPAGAHLGRKVKVKRPGVMVSPMKFSPPTSSMINKNPVKPLNSINTVIPNVPVKKPEPPRPKLPPKNPELVRQPIRDRIIHILAVRPYKRPELLVRLMSEGIREKDKNKVTSILPQLSTLKGNIYYLANYLWNEVQDNWKFCTQEELEIIRKRKQQNLSSSSSSSNSTERETPSNHIQPNNSPIQKHLLNEVETNGHPRNKKQRISHYKGDAQRPNYAANVPEVVTTTLSKKMSYSPSPVVSTYNGISHEDDLSSQKSPASNSGSLDSYSNYNNIHKNTSNTSSDLLLSSSLIKKENGTREDSSRNHTSHQGGSWTPPDRPPLRMKRESDTDTKAYVHSDTGKSQALSHPRSPDSNQVIKEEKDSCSKTVTNGYVNNSNSIKSSYSNQSSYVNNRSKVTSTTSGSCSNSPHSSCDSRDSMDYNDTGLQVPPPTESPTQCDSPEYEKEYGRIVSSEQRARYKANFNAEYGEYLCLHKKIMSISKKFSSLERHLNTYQEGSPEFKTIKSKIIKEYRAYQQDRNYVDALKKFNYLHNKLAHIKRLVTEYDTAHLAKS